MLRNDENKYALTKNYNAYLVTARKEEKEFQSLTLLLLLSSLPVVIRPSRRHRRI
jgi:hypothetical protein